MPSRDHEVLLELFRSRSISAANLLRDLDIRLPAYHDIRTESADLTNLEPTEYRADLVLFLERESKKSLGIIIEVQLDRDENKEYSWPAYIANLRARHRCPVCLLVVTIEHSVALWAGKTIELGPGTSCRPCVIGPANVRAVTVLQEAIENIELAILSAIEHCRGPDKNLAKRIFSTAVEAANHIDTEHSRLYVDFLRGFFKKNAPELLEHEKLEVPMKDMLGFEYESDFAKRYCAQGLEEGLAKGRVEGQRELVLKLLQQLFGPLSDVVQTRVRDAYDWQLEEIALQMFTAKSPEQLLGTLD